MIAGSTIQLFDVYLPMKTPKRIQPLVEEGLVNSVIRQLMSGKEATVFVVRCGDEVRCAKVYKEANQRSLRQNASYQEGRKVKNRIGINSPCSKWRRDSARAGVNQ